MSHDHAGAVAERYFAAWKANDWETLRGLLADDVSFRGPLASIDGGATSRTAASARSR